MELTLEPWPGGRWFRDLGNNTGHFWGHVQVIKPPKLLEIVGPMMMSYPVASHLQYRLTEEADGTRLTLIHQAIGLITAGAPGRREQGLGRSTSPTSRPRRKPNAESGSAEFGQPRTSSGRRIQCAQLARQPSP